MGDNEDIKKEAYDIIEDLENPDTQSEINSIRNEDPMVGLRNSLLFFIKERLLVVSREENFRSEIKNAITDRIKSGEISINQLIELLKMVDRDTETSVNSILGLLKPGNNGEMSPIFGQGGPTGSGEPDVFADMGSRDAEALNKLSRMVQYLEREHSEKSNEGGKE